jgi:hypothetical protein
VPFRSALACFLCHVSFVIQEETIWQRTWRHPLNNPFCLKDGSKEVFQATMALLKQPYALFGICNPELRSCGFVIRLVSGIGTATAKGGF